MSYGPLAFVTGTHPEALAQLPRSPGVYVFEGSGQLPLYIGKSIDLRSRVQAHWRAPDEARMMAQCQRVRCIPTAGELGALLLEARLIKSQHPLFNVRLRRQRRLCTWRAEPGPQGWVLRPWAGGPDDLLGEHPAYGVFASLHAARAQLRTLAEQHRLCLGLLGLEPMSGRGCFGRQLQRCDGACVGQEPRAHHDQRLLAALQAWQVQAWPHAGPIELVERLGDWEQRHRVHQWAHTGTWCSRGDHWQAQGAMGFDLDTYKILLRPVLTGADSVQPLDLV